MEKVKCIDCSFLALKSKHLGDCYKDKLEKRISEPRICKLYELGPMDSVKWRYEQIKTER